MARPTDYTPELLEMARSYLEKAKKTKKLCPTIAELAFTLDISRETVYAWAKQEDKREFSDIVDAIQTLQEVRLVTNGLNGDYNPTVTRLMLPKHGYKEAADITSGGEPITGFTYAAPDQADRETAPGVAATPGQ